MGTLFEDIFESIKKRCEHGSFDYIDSSRTVHTIINMHFLGSQKRYGIYIVRQQRTREVLYIGKSGTLDQQGRFSGQDIPRRLKNQKGKISSKQWFSHLVEEKGPVLVEYLLLTSIPESPSMVEATLLQAYLNEHGCLPYRNNAF